MTVTQTAATMAIDFLNSLTLTEEQKPYAQFIGNVLHTIAGGKFFETKFAIGQEVWTMHNNQPFKGTVNFVQLISDGRNIRVDVTVFGFGSEVSRNECDVFDSQEELLHSAKHTRP